MNVIKRDGCIQEFSFDKVRAVVQKAYVSNNQEVPDKFMAQLEETFNKIVPKKDLARYLLSVLHMNMK